MSKIIICLFKVNKKIPFSWQEDTESTSYLFQFLISHLRAVIFLLSYISGPTLLVFWISNSLKLKIFLSIAEEVGHWIAFCVCLTFSPSISLFVSLPRISLRTLMLGLGMPDLGNDNNTVDFITFGVISRFLHERSQGFGQILSTSAKLKNCWGRKPRGC